MNIKSIIAIALLAVGTFVSSAQAAPWSLSVQGTVDKGRDFYGIFGEVDRDLGGLQYTQTITTETNPAYYSGWGSDDLPPHLSNEYINGLFGLIHGDMTNAVFRISVTINGVTASFDLLEDLISEQVISRGALAPILYPRGNRLYSRLEGTGVDQFDIGAEIDIGAHDAASFDIPTLNFDQQLAGMVPAADGFDQVSEFWIRSGNDDVIYISGTPVSFSVNGAAVPADVPEPASLALLGLGLIGLAAVRRRRLP